MFQGRKYSHFILSATIIILCFSLAACLNLATTGVEAIYNHKNLQQKINDNYISFSIEQDIQANKKFKDSNISIATYQGNVLLAGQVPYEWQKKQMADIANTKNGVIKVYNELQVTNPIPILKRISDIWLTTKIKSKLIASNEVDAGQVKVITENGRVYLMGTLLKEEAEVATAIAKETEGVEKVVKIFTYLQIIPA